MTQTAGASRPENPIAPEESPRGVYRAVAIYESPGKEFAAIYLGERVVCRADISCYGDLAEAAAELNGEEPEAGCCREDVYR